MLCQFAIDQVVLFPNPKADKNSAMMQRFGFIPDFVEGVIVGIKFTKTKILYDILHNIDNEVYHNIEEQLIRMELINGN